MAIKFTNTTSSTAATVNDFWCIYKDSNQTSQLAPVAELRLKRPGDSQPFVVYERPGVYHVGTIPSSIASFSCTRTRTLEPTASTGEIGGLVYHNDELAFSVAAAANWELLSYLPAYTVNFTSTNSLTAIDAAQIQIARIMHTITFNVASGSYAVYTYYNSAGNRVSGNLSATLSAWQGHDFSWYAGAVDQFWTYNGSSPGETFSVTAPSVISYNEPVRRMGTFVGSKNVNNISSLTIRWRDANDVEQSATISGSQTNSYGGQAWMGGAITYSGVAKTGYLPPDEYVDNPRVTSPRMYTLSSPGPITYTLNYVLSNIQQFNIYQNRALVHSDTVSGSYEAQSPSMYTFSAVAEYWNTTITPTNIPIGHVGEITVNASRDTKLTRTLSITPGYGWNAGGRGTVTYVSGTGTSTSTTSEEVRQSITRTVWQGASITWSASAVSMYWNIDSGESQTYPIGDSNITIAPQITLRPEGISECVADTYDDWFDGDYYYVGITFQNYMDYICTIYGTQDSYVSIYGYTYYLDTYGPFYVDKKHDGEFVLSFRVGSGVTHSDISEAKVVISAMANNCYADFTIMEI